MDKKIENVDKPEVMKNKPMDLPAEEEHHTGHDVKVAFQSVGGSISRGCSMAVDSAMDTKTGVYLHDCYDSAVEKTKEGYHAAMEDTDSKNIIDELN